MDKTALFENQIRSLNEIVQILERQLSSHIDKPEEILAQWRKKVYEMLVKNTFLVKQNKEMENIVEKTRDEVQILRNMSLMWKERFKFKKKPCRDQSER